MRRSCLSVPPTSQPQAFKSSRGISEFPLLLNGGSAPKPPGFNAFAPRFSISQGGQAALAISASESALGSHPCVALSSARLLIHIGQKNQTLKRAGSVTIHAGQIRHHSSRHLRHSCRRTAEAVVAVGARAVRFDSRDLPSNFALRPHEWGRGRHECPRHKVRRTERN